MREKRHSSFNGRSRERSLFEVQSKKKFWPETTIKVAQRRSSLRVTIRHTDKTNGQAFNNHTSSLGDKLALNFKSWKHGRTESAY